jgi:hypothetical protein
VGFFFLRGVKIGGPALPEKNFSKPAQAGRLAGWIKGKVPECSFRMYFLDNGWALSDSHYGHIGLHLLLQKMLRTTF